jgi:hypothetical protein
MVRLQLNFQAYPSQVISFNYCKVLHKIVQESCQRGK